MHGTIHDCQRLLTPLEYPKQIWQVGDLPYLPSQKVLWPRSIPPEAGEENMLELPCVVRALLFRLVRRGWAGRAEEGELEEEGAEAFLLIFPVHLVPSAGGLIVL